MATQKRNWEVLETICLNRIFKCKECNKTNCFRRKGITVKNYLKIKRGN